MLKKIFIAILLVWLGWGLRSLPDWQRQQAKEYIITKIGEGYGYMFRRIDRIEPQAAKIPSLFDIQRQLGVKADGKYGPITQAAWDKTIIDENMIERFREAGQE